MPVYVEDNERAVDMSCGVAEFVRRSSLRESFRRGSKRTPHWMTRKSAGQFDVASFEFRRHKIVCGNHLLNLEWQDVIEIFVFISVKEVCVCQRKSLNQR